MHIRLILFIALFTGVAMADIRLIRTSSGRQVSADVHLNGPGLDWLVYLPGSCSHLFDARASFWIPDFLRQRPHNLLVINKAGLTEGGLCPADFDEGALKHNRLADAREVMAEVLPASSTALIAAESEGAYIAPELAESYPNVKGLILLSGGTRGWIDEEIMMAPPEERESVRELLQNEVAGSTDMNRHFRGWTYAQLASYQNRGVLEALMRLKIPVLALHGADDGMIWLQGTLQDWQKILALNPGRKQSVLIPGYGHGVAGPVSCEHILKFTE